MCAVNRRPKTSKRDPVPCNASWARDLAVVANGNEGPRLMLPRGEPDLEALRSVTREWLVPRLVEKFLHEHGIELKHSRKLPDSANRLQHSFSKEQASAVSPISRKQKTKKRL
jgi:hypothetical protein